MKVMCECGRYMKLLKINDDATKTTHKCSRCGKVSHLTWKKAGD